MCYEWSKEGLDVRDSTHLNHCLLRGPAFSILAAPCLVHLCKKTKKTAFIECGAGIWDTIYVGEYANQYGIMMLIILVKSVVTTYSRWGDLIYPPINTMQRNATILIVSVVIANIHQFSKSTN